MNDLIVRTTDGKPDEQKSIAAIESFLRHHPSAIADPTQPNAYLKDGQKRYRTHDYVEHYRNSYVQYVKNYAQNQKTMQDKGFL